MASRSPGRRAPTQVYLVRHAVAHVRGPEWPDDDRRPLTARGAARMRRAVGGLRTLDVRPRVIATSPLIRAEQTAALLAAGLGRKPDVVTVPALAQGHPPALVAKALGELPGSASLAVVGHEPDLGELAAWLLGTARAPAFKKGGVCCLMLADGWRAGGGELLWMATPRMLRRLAH